MKTESISSLNFQSKQIFVRKNQLDLIREISKKMKDKSTMTSTENRFTASYVGAVRSGKCLLCNDTFLHGQNENTKVGKVGKTQIEFNNRTVAIDNETGEITAVKKPWYVSVRQVLRKMDKYLKIINSNFDNDETVIKNSFNIHGFTEKGLERLMAGSLSIDGSVDV